MATRAKKAKTKSRYRNKFKTEWSAEFPGIVSSKGNTKRLAVCTVVQTLELGTVGEAM